MDCFPQGQAGALITLCSRVDRHQEVWAKCELQISQGGCPASQGENPLRTVGRRPTRRTAREPSAVGNPRARACRVCDIQVAASRIALRV